MQLHKDESTHASILTHAHSSWHEECGIFGIWGHHHAAQLTYLSLHSLQHRGQESAGIATVHSGHMQIDRGLGLVSNVFTVERLAALPGNAAIGHVRYSTTGDGSLANAQPMGFQFQGQDAALAHNGNLVNARALRDHLQQQGHAFQSTTDTEVVAHLIPEFGHSSFSIAIQECLRLITGGFAFVFLTTNALVAARDPHGLRPLVIGCLDETWVIASESCALDAIGATLVRDVRPGELLFIDDNGMTSTQFASGERMSLCSFEYIYFARADSTIDGRSVHLTRKALGMQLAREAPATVDVVVGVPDTSLPAAIGFAEVSGLPYDIGLVRNRYVARTFIQPSPALRESSVKLKLTAVDAVIRGKRVAVIDDSIVRGVTSRRIVQLLRDAGASEVHLRVASPPVKHPCYYGIDTSSRDELIAAQLSCAEIAAVLHVDSLVFLSEDGLLQALGKRLPRPEFCNACFTGCYPTEVRDDATKRDLEMEHVRAGKGTTSTHW